VRLIAILQAELEPDGGHSNGAHHYYSQRAEEFPAVREQHDDCQRPTEPPGGITVERRDRESRMSPRARKSIVDTVGRETNTISLRP